MFTRLLVQQTNRLEELDCWSSKAAEKRLGRTRTEENVGPTCADSQDHASSFTCLSGTSGSNLGSSRGHGLGTRRRPKFNKFSGILVLTCELLKSICQNKPRVHTQGQKLIQEFRFVTNIGGQVLHFCSPSNVSRHHTIISTTFTTNHEPRRVNVKRSLSSRF